MNVLDKYLQELNEEQLKAVKYQGSPLFVVAGAGTGKTKTLTMRIAYLIKELRVNPHDILAVTFTNKAAREIRSRVNNIISPEQMGSWLYTFHAFGLRILRMHAEDLKIGYKNDFSIIDETESKAVIKEVIEDLKLDDKAYKVGELKDFISGYKTKMISTFYDGTFEDIYYKYQKYLIKNQLMDFDDLIYYVYELFRTNKEILSRYQNQFKHILIDEFQDTDILQYEIIRLLNNSNTFVVGDPDQSIYQFRGARYENNELFIKDFNAQVMILNKNYRSTNNILRAANSLIKYNKSRTAEKDLISDLGDGNYVNIVNLDTDFAEVDYVLFEINKMLSKGLNYSDIAVLYRNNAMSRGFEKKLIDYNIPYVIYGGLPFYQRKEVKDILSYIKVAVDKDSNFFLKRIINTPKRSIGKTTIEKLEKYSEANNISMFEAIDLIDLPKKTMQSLIGFKNIILNIENKINKLMDLKDVVDLVFNESNYKIVLDEELADNKEERIENINELKSFFQDANELSGTNIERLKQVLDDLALVTDKEVKSNNKDAVILATVHQVKGLEFTCVFVVGLEDDVFPNHRASFDNTKIEEERRLFYVAITRAKKYLYLTSTERRRLYGKIDFNRPSMFLRELKTYEEKPKVTPIIGEKPRTMPKLNINASYNVSDIVIHENFGKGIIVEIKGDVLTIAFSMPHGIKKILGTHPSIRKESKE